MATSVTRNVSVRLVVVEGDKAIRTINNFGDIGDRAIKKIVNATAPASKGLMAVSVVSEQVRFGLDNLAGGAGTLGTSLSRLGPWGLVAAAAIGAVGLAAAKGLSEFKEAEQALNGLNAALKATDSASGVTAREITALGEAVEANTLFKKEEIQKAAASLTSFQSVAGDTFTRALALSADLATRLGTDLPSAADMLGRSLENPEDGLGRLARKFSDLSPAQKEAISNFVKQGEIASAQAVILEHLEGKTKGLAAAQAQGLTGAADTLGDAWDDLMESFGRTVAESGNAQASLLGLTQVVRSLQQAIDNSPQKRKSELEKEISGLEGGFGIKVDRFFLGSAPGLDAKKEELRRINERLAAEQLDAENEKRRALTEADKAAARQRNDALLAIEKDFQKKFKEATQTERDKIIAESEEARQRIQSNFKDNRNSDSARSALEAVTANERARLAKLDEEAAKPALALAEANNKIVESLQKRVSLEGLGDPRSKFIQAEVDKLNASATDAYKQKVEELAGALYDREQATKAAKEADEAYKKAVQDINREVIRLKPSYDTAKQALDEWMQKMVADLGTATEESQRYLAVLQEIYDLKLKEIYDKSLENSRKWEDGVTRGLSKYANEATNAAKNAEELFGSAARKVEDTLVDMVSTGEFSFKKLGDLVLSIEQDILRIFIRQNITGPIAGGLSKALGGGGSSGDQGIFGSFFDDIFSAIMHSGGVVGETSTLGRSVSASTFARAPRLHNGLMPDEFPAILQKGETVIPKNQRSQMMGGMNVTFNINTPNPQAFMDSRGQMLSKFAGEMQRMRTRNG